MFRDMKELAEFIGLEEAREFLENSNYGILSTIGRDGKPYGVPLSYVCAGDSFYFHTSCEGRKLENIEFCKNVSFCVVGGVQPVCEGFTSKYESCIAFGKVEEVEGEEKKAALMNMVSKYSPRFMNSGMTYIEEYIDKVRIFKLNIEEFTAKYKA